MSAPAAAFTQNELLAVMGSRQLRDDQTVFTGVGAPMMASVLAQRRHAPRLTMVIEGGIVGPRWRTGWLPISTNEMRCAYRAQMLPAIITRIGTDKAERMEIVAGSCIVKLDGQSATAGYSAGQAFEVPAKSGFDIEVSSGICEYICSFLP